MACRLANLYRSIGLQPGRPRGDVPGEPGRVPGPGLGRPLRRPLLHGHQLPAHGRGAGLHRRGLRQPGPDHLAGQGRAGGGARGSARRARPAGVGRRAGRRLRAAGGPAGRAVLRGTGRRRRGSRDALLLRHHRSAQGGQGPLHRSPARHRRGHDVADHAGLRRRRPVRLPLSRPAVPRRPDGVLHELPPHRGDGRRHGALRRRGGPRPHRALPGHAQPVGPDHVRAHAQAAPRGAHGPRPELDEGRRPRRCALPGASQGADDRVVGPGHPRVLRRHRGQRLLLLQQRGVAGPQGHGRPGPDRPGPHPRRGGPRGARRARRARSGSGRPRPGGSSSTTTTPTRRRAATGRTGRAPWATSAGWTRTASSTSPTARPT